MKIRLPAVAGTFYPGDRAALKQEIESYLAEAVIPTEAPKAMIVPHAGTVYSGPVAASAYAGLQQVKDHIRRVVLLGPAHRVALRGMALSSAEFFRTPLGDVPVDREALAGLQGLGQVRIADEPHRQEHSLELQIPFLQRVLEEFTLVPVVVGLASPGDVADVLSRLWGGRETLVVVSTDLSHYQDYQTSRLLDEETARFIERMEWEKLQDDRACGFFPLCGFLKVAKEKRMTGKCVDLRNSGDTAGDKDRVVGYGAFYFYEPD